ncbi:MAG: methyltransferase domain-containing protein [Candidatus Pacebacteria bacterium]|nr:methyltransferase domain-containing protein [Candidatus Paceibacterota bacterium]
MNTETEPSLVIHHLSDIHVGLLHYEAAQKLPFPRENQSPRNLLLYNDHLSDSPLESLPDLLIISGDLTSYALEDEMNQVKDAIQNIKNRLMEKNAVWRKNNTSPYILMVPGNHDLDWSQDSCKAKIERYARMSDSLYDGGKVLSAVYWSEGYPVFCDFGDACNVFVYLFNTTSLGGLNDPKLEEIYRSLSEHYIQIFSDDESRKDFHGALASLEKEMRKDPGYMHPNDLKKMRQELEKVPQHRFKVAVMHHNLSSVPSDDIEKFDAIINAGPIKQSLMDNRFDLVLHGHRHFIHCCHERFISRSESQARGIFILGGDAFGIEKSAPFLEVRLYGTDKAHVKELSTRSFTVSLAEHRGSRYDIESPPFIEEKIDIEEIDIDKLVRRFERNSSPSNKKLLLERINMNQLRLQKIESKLVDWGYESRTWIGNFHIQLAKYHRIWATDVFTRSSMYIPRFNKYLREQYAARLRNLKSSSNQFLSFDSSVYNAIMRTGWQPDPIMWGNYPIKKKINNSGKDLEIVRILVRPKDTLDDWQELENLDFDHKLFAIPLFVLDCEQLESSELVDFTIGFDKDGTVIKCYEFKETDDRVSEVELGRGLELINIFNQMLSDTSLKTVDTFIGKGMIKVKFKEFAEKYDESRKANTALLKVLRQNLNPNLHEIGLDIGCGTGNYTIPLVDDFDKVFGLDNSKEMLDVARKKSNKVDWIQKDALQTGLPDKYCDAVWLISTLHYFIGERQNLLFREIYRILKPGGVVVADTEFKEQHDSLWLVEFFPSLRNRYKDACLSIKQYETWLQDIGFSNFRFEHLFSDPTENDAFLRIGQHEPELYLDGRILKGIPAFHEMQPSELERGMGKLRNAINDDTINEIITRYEEKASMEGDIGIIIATRPL